MSGIVGIVNPDGKPADAGLLRRLTDALAFRGPDAQAVWHDGPAALGLALLATTDEAARERQPCSLDGQTWVTADARVDGRDDLIKHLGAAGRTGLRTASDAELILHAYSAWGEECVRHLLGDFAFAVWDGPRRRLFCARDHFGVKPFYYATTPGGGLAFSNTLDCLRDHPAVSERLNDQAVGDFLVLGFNHDPGTTTFADVQRLPPAHTMTWADGRVCLRRYWSLPAEGEARHRRGEDIVGQFRALLRQAVADRLRTRRIGIYMSGGLDSTSLAATARDVLAAGEADFDLRAYTTVWDHLIPDEERRYAGLAAEALGVPVHFFAADDYRPFEGWAGPGLRTPEPIDEPTARAFFDQADLVTAHGRVVLTGQGGDAALYPSPLYLMGLLRRLRWGRWLAEVGRYVRARRRLPPLGLRTQLQRWLGRRRRFAPYPRWLNLQFAERLQLRERWERFSVEAGSPHPTRARAHAALQSPYWVRLFESFDPGVTRRPLEFRHPFFDVRLLGYLLTLPPMPWFVDKHLLREALRGVLPDAVRLRPKRPLAADPLGELVRRGEVCWQDHLAPLDKLKYYIDVTEVRRAAAAPWRDARNAYALVAPLSLGYWSVNQSASLTQPEESHAFA
jgi:asparagine synthase (glutamine-hydrolysing)